MINIQQVQTQRKITIKLSDGRIVQIQSDPFNLKKEVLRKELNVKSEHLLLVNAQTQEVLCLNQIIQQMQDGRNVFEVRDANSLLKENEILKSQSEASFDTIHQRDDQIRILQAEINHKTLQNENKLFEDERKLQTIQEAHNGEINKIVKEKERQLQDANLLIDDLQTQLANSQKNHTDQMNFNAQETQKKINDLKSSFNAEREQQQRIHNEQFEQFKQELLAEHYRLMNELKILCDYQERQIDELYKQENNLKWDKNDLEMQVYQLWKENIALEEEIKRKSEKIGSIQSEQQKGTGVNKEIVNFEQENVKLKSKVEKLERELESVKDLHKKFNEDLKLKEEKFAQERRNNQNEMDKLKLINKQREFEIEDFKAVKLSLSNQLENLKHDAQENTKKLSSQREQIAKQDQDIQNLTNRIKEITNEVKEYKQQAQQNKQTIDIQLNGINTQKQECAQLQNQLTEANIAKQSLEINLEHIKQALQQSKNNQEKVNLDFREHRNKMNNEIARLNDEQQFQDKIKKKVRLEYQNGSADIILGPIEKLSKLTYGIKNFEEDPNSQRDNTEYNIFEITLDQDKAIDLLRKNKEGYMFMDEAIKITDLGSIKTVRSIQPNVDATYVKGYIIKIESATSHDLQQQQILLRKEFKHQQNLISKEAAAKLSLNNLMCKMFLDKFKQDLGQCKLNSQKIKIQRQFVLQIKGNMLYILGKNEFFYCEQVDQGNYSKIQLGEFDEKYPDIHQYINSFALYVSFLMKKELIITNFSVLGKYLHDMIVTGNAYKFSILDQGLSEFQKVIQTIEKLPKNKLSAYWNKELEQIASKGI